MPILKKILPFVANRNGEVRIRNRLYPEDRFSESVGYWHALLEKQLSACGEPDAYPQDGMCKKCVFLRMQISIHLRCTVNTSVFQQIQNDVNR